MSGTESTQWLFTEAELLSSPSILHGLEPGDERCRRAKGVNFILQVGMLLKLPQLTLAVASVFFHRFYMRRSLAVETQHPSALHHYVRPSSPREPTPSPSSAQVVHPSSHWTLPRSRKHLNLKAKEPTLTFESMEQNVAATALFLATKTEENCRKTKEIVIAVAKVAQKNTSLIIDEQSKEYWRWRDSILLYEELMLELLTFDVVLPSPYKYLYEYIQQLQIDEIKPIRNVAWAFLNDSCMTTLCLQMPAASIAIAAIYFAVKFHGETIPDDEHGAPWWEKLGGDPPSIVKAVGIMHDFWLDNPLKQVDKPYGAAEYSSSQEDLEGTRRRNSTARSSDADSMNVSQNGSTKRKVEEDGDGEEVNGEAPAAKKARTDESPDDNEGTVVGEDGDEDTPQKDNREEEGEVD